MKQKQHCQEPMPDKAIYVRVSSGVTGRVTEVQMLSSVPTVGVLLTSF